ncbi:DISARM system helicase DrmA [Bdellovibrio bacteriovorus]|uniref:DISARM system helicase DrmA n=1 Tax=Bdellovibrio bacteriovorus TaxID=959 RepID=UPI003AA8675E
MKSTDIRENIVDAMNLDLIGPSHNSEQKYLQEVLSVPPSAYYLTGFLVPHGSKIQVDVEEDDANVSPDDTDDNAESGGDEANSLIKRFPSSIGMSFLLKKETKEFEVVCRWGEYRPQQEGDKTIWPRIHIEKTVKVVLSSDVNQRFAVTNEVELIVNQKILNLASDSYNLLEDGTKSLSVFLVNRKPIKNAVLPDDSFMFQAEMEIHAAHGFCPRPNLRALESTDPDDSIADLQFANIHEYATGHGVAALFEAQDGSCNKITTSWMPSYEVEGVQSHDTEGLELRMEELAKLDSFEAAKVKLSPLLEDYKQWIKKQSVLIPKGIKKREDTGNYLVGKYNFALKRIEDGINLLQNNNVLESFKVANLVMAEAAKKRRSDTPKWRTFQLAFVLMNLKGIINPADSERDTVDLLYFPTGGGKTEAYLGVVAFTLVYRRLVDPTITSAGVSVLMRYTLRLLTLDQLERATTLICALEKVRRDQKTKWNLGESPYEIGLWVGKAGTPNKFGKKGLNRSDSARDMLRAYQNSNGKSPVPLENCCWCGERLHKDHSFKFDNNDIPMELKVICNNRECDFTASKFGKLPLVVVDEEIYRKLPCFIISTVDKLASMPWEEKVGKLFGRVDKFHKDLGFFSSTENQAGAQRLAGELKPLDLIIQDELHLISGPLGTMVGLYETAVDELSSRTVDGKKIKAKIIASTATVRHAQKQVKALYGRSAVDIFPVPGVTSKDSFFAKTVPVTKESPGRLYVGIAAQGRSTKNLLSKSYLSSMSAAQKQLDLTGNSTVVDPYMTALGYFNSLRELGGARRIIEDEVNSKLRNYSAFRKRESEPHSDILANRVIKFEVLELTSREDTARVALAKHRLSRPHGNNEFVNVAIATNMISVGLDITRLGLMLVFGQPKTTSEYIQASSRVGRGSTPGLVVTLYNIHRHRDRSLYERFVPYHQSYYRDVETTSVTPFSTKALDKGLAGTYLSIVRHLIDGMRQELDAGKIASKKNELGAVVSNLILHRLGATGSNQATSISLQKRLNSLLDDWEKILKFAEERNEELTYTDGDHSLIHQYLDPKLDDLPNYYLKFRANRSMREVEPTVNIWVKGMNDQDLED